MDLGKHFYNWEHKLTETKNIKTNYALDIIDFILQNRKYLNIGKIVDKAKYHADIDAKLKSAEQMKKKRQMREPIVQAVVTESEEEFDDGDDLTTIAEKKKRQWQLKNRATKDLQKQPRSWAEVDKERDRDALDID